MKQSNIMVRKIGLVSRYPPVHCGIAEYTKMLISALKSLNPKLEIYVFTTNEYKEESWYDDLGVNVIPCYSLLTTNYSTFLDMLNEYQVDVLHIQHEYGIYGAHKEVINALVKAREDGLTKKVVVTMHTVDHSCTVRKETLKFQARLNDFDAVIVHSFLQEFELLMQGVDAKKLYRIPHGTLINPYLRYTKDYLARSLGIKDELKGMILSIPGFLRKDKGIDILLEAMDMVDGRFTILIAGKSQDPQLQELILSNDSVYVIDRYLSTDEILRIVALADAIVLPYKDRYGAYAVSGILHLSMGGLKPIIGSRTPRLIELYQYAPHMTVPAQEPKELANKINWLVNNYEYAVAYMSDLYAYAAKTQWIRVGYHHLKLYQMLL
ncbi:MAG TPA: glycosyltransferase [Archaeoglobus profundus]|nr:glycosyltransferase [Archaeoglobus profundus]